MVVTSVIFGLILLGNGVHLNSLILITTKFIPTNEPK